MTEKYKLTDTDPVPLAAPAISLKMFIQRNAKSTCVMMINFVMPGFRDSTLTLCKVLSFMWHKSERLNLTFVFDQFSGSASVNRNICTKIQRLIQNNFPGFFQNHELVFFNKIFEMTTRISRLQNKVWFWRKVKKWQKFKCPQGYQTYKNW